MNVSIRAFHAIVATNHGPQPAEALRRAQTEFRGGNTHAHAQPQDFHAGSDGHCGGSGLAACGGEGAGSGGPDTDAAPSEQTVGVAMPTQTYERWVADGNNIKEGLEGKGFTVDMQYADDDIPTQQQQIDQMINSGVSVLLIASIDGASLSAQLDAAAAAGIPVVAYDRLLTDSENVDFYVTFDNYKVGVNQANALLYGLGLLDESFEPADDAPEGPLNVELFAGSLAATTRTCSGRAPKHLQPYLDDGTLGCSRSRWTSSRPPPSAGNRRRRRSAWRTC